jgi:hypothetical protein
VPIPGNTPLQLSALRYIGVSIVVEITHAGAGLKVGKIAQVEHLRIYILSETQVRL